MSRDAAALFLATLAACRAFGGSDSTSAPPGDGSSDGGADSAPSTAEGGPPQNGDAGACLAPTANIVAWWTADGTPQDHGGQFPLSAVGNSIFVYSTGEVAQAFDLTAGSGSGMNPEDPLKGASAFTIELWLATQGDGRLLGNHDGTNGYVLDVKDGNPRLTINAVAASATTSLAIGAWTHVAAVWGGSSVTVYVNGQVAGSRSGVAAPATSSAGFLIGAGSNGAVSGAAALLDEITLHGRALTQGEIRAIVTVGAGGRCK